MALKEFLVGYEDDSGRFYLFDGRRRPSSLQDARTEATKKWHLEGKNPVIFRIVEVAALRNIDFVPYTAESDVE